MSPNKLWASHSTTGWDTEECHISTIITVLIS